MEDTMILLVEDDPNDELLTLVALSRNKINSQVFVVRDGAEALDYLFCRNTYAERNPHELPQLILLDLKLPKLDGLDVLCQIRANESTSFLPVIVLAPSNEESTLLKAYESGGNSYIRKPVNFDQFMGYVQKIGLFWLGLNNPPPG